MCLARPLPVSLGVLQDGQRCSNASQVRRVCAQTRALRCALCEAPACDRQEQGAHRRRDQLPPPRGRRVSTTCTRASAAWRRGMPLVPPRFARHVRRVAAPAVAECSRVEMFTSTKRPRVAQVCTSFPVDRCSWLPRQCRDNARAFVVLFFPTTNNRVNVLSKNVEEDRSDRRRDDPPGPPPARSQTSPAFR